MNPNEICYFVGWFSFKSGALSLLIMILKLSARNVYAIKSNNN
jgi:hypothetical protein